MRRGRTYAVAIGGVLSAAAISLMLLGAIIPFATFLSPALAAVCVLYFCIEYSKKTAFAVYFVISALSLLLSADKEQALIFTFILGYYPILKTAADGIKCRLSGLLLKFAVFNAAILGLYYCITHILVIAAVRAEFAAYGTALTVALVLLANVTLFFYDLVLTRLALLYIVRLRPKLTSQK